ncbi:hypothetical protein ACQR3P_29170 [Rhodococcus sp. IEGM1300]
MIIKAAIPGTPKPSAYVKKKIHSSSNYPFNSKTPVIVPGDVFTVLSFEKDSYLFICVRNGTYFTVDFEGLNGILSGAVVPRPIPAPLMRALSTLNYMFVRHVFKGDIELEDPVLHEINDFLLEVLSDESLLRNNAYKAVISEEIYHGEYVNNLRVSEAKNILFSYFRDIFQEQDALKMTNFYIDLIPVEAFLQDESESPAISEWTDIKAGNEKVRFVTSLNKIHDNEDYPNSDELMIWLEIDGYDASDIHSIFIKKGSLLS